MSDESQSLAVQYLTPSLDSPWHWHDGGRVIAWSDGKTVAFRQQVETVLARLAPQGLPPFGSIVLLLAACRDGWENSSPRQSIVNYARVFGQWRTHDDSRVSVQSPQIVFARLSKGLRQVLHGLDTVARLPKELRQTPASLGVLAETVFEPARKALSPQQAKLIVEAMSAGVHPERLAAQFTSRESLSQFAEDADALLVGLATVDEASLSLRLRTGLDQLIDKAELEISPSQRVRQLLAELSDDPELAGLAKLAQDLMAAIHVPRNLQSHQELPVGGVSDLSNRGPLDRLLISELANDGLTLAVRVAMNEALYLRRESPPKNPPQRRAILLDLGIRLWGVPRVFAIATALALVATADKDAAVDIYYASRNRIKPIDLTSRRGLIECMEVLETLPHPAAALAPFLETIGADDGEIADCILITHANVISDTAFRTALSATQPKGLFVATVDAEGSFQLHVFTPTGRRLLSQAKLNLDRLVEHRDSPSRPASLITGPPAATLPVILTVEPFPLRLPAFADAKCAGTSKRHGLVAVMADGRLLHWPHAITARQLAVDLPKGTVRGVVVHHASARAFVCIVHRSDGQVYLSVADLNAGTCQTFLVQTSGPLPSTLQILSGVPVLISAAPRAIDPGSGRTLARLHLAAGMRWRGGRYFWDARGWHALAYNGSRLVLEPTPFQPKSADVQRLFDRDGHQGGPWAVMDDGLVVNCTTLEQVPQSKGLRQRIDRVRIAPNGNRIVGRAAASNYLLDLNDSKGWKPLDRREGAMQLLAPEIGWSRRMQMAVDSDFQAIGLDAERHLCLWQRGQPFSIVNDGQVRLRWQKNPSRLPQPPKAFTAVKPPGEARFSLGMARWDDGSKAWLDGRGLLHLRSSDALLPELTLVLWPAPGRLGGWSSDGRRFGPTELFPSSTELRSDLEFWEVIQQFVLRLR